MGEATGWDDEGLRRLDRAAARHVGTGAVPGAVWLVEHGDEVHVGTAGATSTDGGAPMRRDTIFRISSMTKPIVAAAAMALVEDCTIRLDDPVARWLPELGDLRVLEHLDAPLSWTVPAVRPPTVRDLLTSTAGWGQAFAEPGAMPIADALAELELGQGAPDPSTPPEPDEWLRRLATLPLLHHPGAAWAYNTCSDVLGVLLARAAGAPLGDVLRARLFEPLGMVDTGFHVPATALDRFCTAYWTDPDTAALTTFDEPHERWASPPAFPSGAGGLVSTADDMAAFGRMLRDQGRGPGGRVLSRTSVEVMTSDQLTPEQRASADVGGGFTDTSWGFGLSVRTRRTSVGPAVGSFGWAGGLGTTWTVDPAEDVTTIVMTQAAWASPRPPALVEDVHTAAYAALP